MKTKNLVFKNKINNKWKYWNKNWKQSDRPAFPFGKAGLDVCVSAGFWHSLAASLVGAASGNGWFFGDVKSHTASQCLRRSSPYLCFWFFFLSYGDFLGTDAHCDRGWGAGDWEDNAFSDIGLSLFFFKNVDSKWEITGKKRVPV